MDDRQKGVAYELWNAARESGVFSQTRCSELADEYTRLEVQIATIILAFVGLLIDKLPPGNSASALFFKGIFTLTVLAIVGSLIAGLLHIKRKEWWWDDRIEERSARRKEWEKAITNDDSFDIPKAFANGTNIGNETVRYSPTWSWVLQTVLLGVGVFSLIVLQLAFIFSR